MCCLLVPSDYFMLFCSSILFTWTVYICNNLFADLDICQGWDVLHFLKFIYKNKII